MDISAPSNNAAGELTMASPTDSSSSTSWSDLPTEIELYILEYCLLFDQPIDRTDHDKNKGLVVKIAQLNKHLSILAQELYYSKNTFVVGRFDERWYAGRGLPYVPPHLRPWPTRSCIDEFYAAPLSYPNPAVAHWVRKMILKVKVNFVSAVGEEGYSTRERVNESDWRFLLGEHSAGWQDQFKPNELRVVVSALHFGCMVLGGTGGGVDLERPGDNVRATVKTSKANLVAGSVVVVVENYICSDDGFPGSVCNGSCAKAVKEGVEGLFT